MVKPVSAVTPSTGFISRLTDNFATQKVSSVVRGIFALLKAIGNYAGKIFKPVSREQKPFTLTGDLLSPKNPAPANQPQNPINALIEELAKNENSVAEAKKAVAVSFIPTTAPVTKKKQKPHQIKMGWGILQHNPNQARREKPKS